MSLRLALSHVRPRRRLPLTPRRLHQAVARKPPSQLTSVPSSVPSFYNDDHLHALYEDLMALETTNQPQRIESPSEAIDITFAEYAERGNIRDLELSFSRMSVPLTDYQRDLHVKAHIVNTSLSTRSSSHSIQHFPKSALAVLHQYEASGHVAPIKSYTRVISALFNVKTCPSSDPRLGRTAAQAQAWDLFAHMRYVAHPAPDAHLYALMIRACGSFPQPTPERALDLWTEMHENGVKPTKGAYEAVIRVCGKAGPEWLGESMRLAREMSEQYPITGADGRGLWCALLEGCKRAGDLKKARWILAEAVRGNDLLVDAELMTHVFHTYASYDPPFRRETTQLVDPGSGSNAEPSTEESQATEISRNNTPLPDMPATQTSGGDVPRDIAENVPTFSHLPPQTPSDVVAETRALLNKIFHDKYPSVGKEHYSVQSGWLMGKFAHVELTPALLNAYLSVYYKHASIDSSREAFNSLFNDSSSAHAFVPDEYSCINALERCAIARTEDRHIATRWAQDLWRRWEVMEVDGSKTCKESVGSFARLIERAHTAMRRVLALSGDIDGALALLRSFVGRYPPNSILQPASSSMSPMTMVPIKSPSRSATVQLFATPPILSTRTVLTNPVSVSSSSTARPLVRLSSAATSMDDRIPPFIGFSDVDLLHARLVERGRTKDLGYIKWVCMAYRGALKKRRDMVIKVTATRSEDEVD